MTFYDAVEKNRWQDIREQIVRRTEDDVINALSPGTLDIERFISLVSPAADKMIEEIAQKAQLITEQRFGRIVGLYAPMYLSNSCANSCVYCSFNASNQIGRETLTVEQAVSEATHLHDQGFRHILLVSGEDLGSVSLAYLKEVVGRLRTLFDSISIEIYPMEADEYRELAGCGVDGLIIYQETYNPELYAKVHIAGKKSDYRWRIETPERGGAAGFRRVGIGALLGLDDWRTEAVYLAMHARHIMKRHWRSQVTISFPRLRPAVGGYAPPDPVSDRDLVHMLTALRVFLPDAGLLLSTRESKEFRDNMIPLGVTSMSAGSCTQVGGYTGEAAGAGQFEIADHRSPEEVAETIKNIGYEPVWKDWDAEFIR
ncbi:MAG: 2-iminoacetate synthase ThiH [Pseudomonadota bacterium]|jgi:2-iminoacetate synthase